MIEAEWADLLPSLQSNRDATTNYWFSVIANTDFTPIDTLRVREQLASLTDQVIALLLAKSFDHHRAQALGVALAQLHYLKPRALGNTQEALAQGLFAGLPADDIATLQPRFIAILSGISIGFVSQMQETILVEQEQIRRALCAEYKRVEAILTEAQQWAAESREVERLHRARELHDSVVQQILGISYQLTHAQRQATNMRDLDPQRGSDLLLTLEVVRKETLEAVKQLRWLISELRPAELDELGLTAAIESYVARLKSGGRPDLPVIELDLDRSGTVLPTSVALCLFRIAQEALRNALKHAQAQHISLRLRLHPTEAVLSVRDDGQGFQAPGQLSELTRANHFGLMGIAERVACAGGRLTLWSQLEEGTDVIVHIPLNTKGPVDDQDDPGALSR